MVVFEREEAGVSGFSSQEVVWFMSRSARFPTATSRQLRETPYGEGALRATRCPLLPRVAGVTYITCTVVNE